MMCFGLIAVNSDFSLPGSTGPGSTACLIGSLCVGRGLDHLRSDQPVAISGKPTGVAGYFSAKPHIFLMTTFLMFRCPTTSQQCECDVATDAATLAKVWKMTKDMKCKICGEMHQIKIRDAFLDMAMSREIVTSR